MGHKQFRTSRNLQAIWQWVRISHSHAALFSNMHWLASLMPMLSATNTSSNGTWLCRTEISGQETIEAANHLCLFLPKFHCELNFIEFFWGVVKKYLRDNCDYTFDTLKENLPKALCSVHIHTIRRWEHRIFRWIEAYRSGLGTREAQVQVRKFSSTMYKSHRCIPEGVASAFD